MNGITKNNKNNGSDDDENEMGDPHNSVVEDYDIDN